MGLKVDKDNIYIMIPSGKYSTDNRIDEVMDGSFTIYTKVKIIKDNMISSQEAFIFARNGQHAGLSVVMDNNGVLFVKAAYWFMDENSEIVYKQMFYMLPPELEDEFNEYIFTCDDTIKLMKLYVNGIECNSIDYSNLTKQKYADVYIWLGCGSMTVAEDKYKHIGEFEYEMVVVSDILINVDELTKIVKEYDINYLTYDEYSELPVLSDNIPYKEHLKIFTDFKHRNKYKIWNLAGNYNNFQLYIENKINF